MSAALHENPENDPAADGALVRDALAGVVGAEERLAQRVTVVLRFLVVLNRRHGSRLSRQDVEDLAQDTAIKTWQKLATFRGDTTLNSWLYRFAYFEFLNRSRKRSRAPRRDRIDVESLMDANESEDFLEGVEQIETSLEELGPPDATILRLKHFDDLSFTQIADRLGIPTSTAKARYYRGLAWMQRRLGSTVREVQP